MTKPVPELRFGFRRFETLEPCPPPPGYAMRSFRPGDEDDWLGLLQSDPDWQWDRARLGRLLAGEQGPIPEDGVIFATYDDKPVSTACITLQQEHGATVPSFGWVVTHPEHRRHG